MNFDRGKLSEFVKRCKWIWASSMMAVPHEYIHRDHCELTRKEFYYFVSAQRELGVRERWGQYIFPYLYLDGYKYWTMGDPFETTWILNRQKVFGEFDFLEWPLQRDYSDEEIRIVANAIMNNYSGKSVFECGFGNGDFIKFTKLSPDLYYGVDPARKAINQLRERMEGYYRRCSKLSFEEAVTKWLSLDCVVVSLFGAPSYFMRQYLSKLNDSGRDYFLMFYAEGYTPVIFREMHQFGYTKSEILSIFPRSYVYNNEKYLIITSKKIDWNEPPKQTELFPI